jgi:hypothetical protein
VTEVIYNYNNPDALLIPWMRKVLAHNEASVEAQNLTEYMSLNSVTWFVGGTEPTPNFRTKHLWVSLYRFVQKEKAIALAVEKRDIIIKEELARRAAVRCSDLAKLRSPLAGREPVSTALAVTTDHHTVATSCATVSGLPAPHSSLETDSKSV